MAGSDLLEAYDPGPLIERYARAQTVLHSGRSEVRLSDTADELCGLYELILADQLFWEVAGQAVREADSDDGIILRRVQQLLGDLEQFCGKEVDLLIAAGFEEQDASELVNRLAVTLWNYRTGTLVDVEEMKTRLDQLKVAVCATIPSLVRYEERRAAWLILMRALGVAGCVVGAASVIPSLSSVNFELAFTGYLLELSQLLISWSWAGSDG